MKNPVWRVLWLAFVLMASLSAGAAAIRRGERVPVPGRAYVPLASWARANEFEVRLLERDKILELSNRSARLVFTLDPRQDSRKTRINGVTVWLALPLLTQGGRTFISQTDLASTLGPVLAPFKRQPVKKLKTICIDPGHGGKDPGFRVGSQEEKKYTLLLAQEVRGQLAEAGFNVFLTRASDSTVRLEDRSEIARRRGADVFVSLHFNASEDAPREVRGVEIFCCTPAGATSTNARGEGDTHWVQGNRNDELNMLLAYQMQKACLRTLQVEDRGVKRARFQVLRDATMPAILIEGGFMSHPLEGKRIFDPAYRRQMARAVVSGLLGFQKTATN
jgi:N-acetylmuramoyl-L-alanine amidase